MQVKLTRISAIVFCAAAAGLIASCTISSNNGHAADVGSSGGKVPTVRNAFVDGGKLIGVNDTAIIRVSVVEDTAANDTTPLAGQAVTVSVDSGSLVNTKGAKVSSLVATSGTDGTLAVKYIDSVSCDSATVTITIGSIKRYLTIIVTDSADKIQRAIRVSASPSTILANDSSTSTITVTVIDTNHNPIAGEAVQFSATAGTIVGDGSSTSSGRSLTNAKGVATATLTSTSINTISYVTAYLVSDKSLQAKTQVVFTGVNITTNLDSTNLAVGASVDAKITLQDGSDNVLTGIPVYFKLAKGASSNLTLTVIDTVTDGSGQARIRLTGNASGSDTLYVNAAGASASFRVNVTDLKLKLLLEANVLQATSSLYTMLYADFTDLSNKALASKNVTVVRHYKTINSADTTDTLKGKTDANGTASFRIYATGWETDMRLEVSAANGSDVASANANVSFIKTRNISIVATPNQISADGATTSQIVVQIKNEKGNPIVGDSVLYSTDAGMVTASAVADDNGRAAAVLTSDRRNTTATVIATLARDPSIADTVHVIFAGVTLAASLSPISIASNGVDSSTVTVKLLDAQKNPITGEKVNYFRSSTTETITILDSVTDNQGEAHCLVRGTGVGSDTVTISAAGATTKAVVFYSSNSLTIDTAAGSYVNAIADSSKSLTFIVTYKNSAKKVIVGDSVDVSVTMGTIDTASGQQVGGAFSVKGVTNSNGQFIFTVKNPMFATTATIVAIASGSNTVTQTSFNIYYRAVDIAKLTLVATPSVINISGDKSQLTVTAYDKLGNRASGVNIAFNVLSGPGGGEYVSPASVVTALDGTATTNFMSGTLPSEPSGVKLVAATYLTVGSSGNSINSDTVALTIAGPPHNVTLTEDFAHLTTPSPSTYGKNISVIVTDVNNNPVADGTPVTFSAQVTGYAIYTFYDSVPHELSYEDLNNNLRLDPGEDINNDGYLNRGEDRDGDGKITSGPKFDDINGDGERNYRFNPQAFAAWVASGHTPTSYKYYGDWSEPLLIPAYDCLDSATHTHWVDTLVQFVDLNGNHLWDYREPCIDSVYNIDANYENPALGYNPTFPCFYHPKILGCYPDIDWLQDGIMRPNPNTAMTITKTVSTVNGIAPNLLEYGRSDGGHIYTKISAECKGITASPPLQELLGITTDDAPYWNRRQ